MFKDHRDGTAPLRIPRLRSYLLGSAGNGKSKTLKTCVRHIRRLFQRENIDATVALTAYTGVAAFNMKFGAKTACSAFNIGRGKFEKELTGQRQRQCEVTWKSVVLLIVDAISFIGKAFFAQMHHRVRQGKRELWERALVADGFKYEDIRDWGNMSIILVGDFGQLDSINDWSFFDTEATYHRAPSRLRGQWGYARQGHVLLELFSEAVVFREAHRSKEDQWWTKSCLDLCNFELRCREHWES